MPETTLEATAIRDVDDSPLAGQDYAEHVPGLYAGIPAEDYHDVDACSSSRLTLCMRSPAHAREAMLHPTPSTDAQRIGTATHTAILEPDLLNDLVAVAEQCDVTTGKGTQCSYNGKVLRTGQWYCGRHDPGEEAGKAYAGLVVSQEDRDAIARMRDEVRAHPAASELLTGGHAELTALFQHELVDGKTGEVVHELACKSRIDYWQPETHALVDLKTTQDASEEAFQKSVWNWGYFRQLAFYRYALERLGRDVDRCVIVAVEKSAPYAVAVYQLDETSLKAGWRQVEDLLGVYAMCEVAGEWPAYSDRVQPLSLPHWAWNQL